MASWFPGGECPEQQRGEDSHATDQEKRRLDGHAGLCHYRGKENRAATDPGHLKRAEAGEPRSALRVGDTFGQGHGSADIKHPPTQANQERRNAREPAGKPADEGDSDQSADQRGTERRSRVDVAASLRAIPVGDKECRAIPARSERGAKHEETRRSRPHRSSPNLLLIHGRHPFDYWRIVVVMSDCVCSLSAGTL